MIEVKELRPGNLLRREGYWVPLDAQAIYDIAATRNEAEHFETIPLSAAILERCGFRNGSIRVSNDVGWAFKLEVVKGEMVLAVQEYALPVNCKYLHQLQNLFYALTGEELKVPL